MFVRSKIFQKTTYATRVRPHNTPTSYGVQGGGWSVGRGLKCRFVTKSAISLSPSNIEDDTCLKKRCPISLQEMSYISAKAWLQRIHIEVDEDAVIGLHGECEIAGGKQRAAHA